MSRKKPEKEEITNTNIEYNACNVDRVIKPLVTHSHWPSVL